MGNCPSCLSSSAMATLFELFTSSCSSSNSFTENRDGSPYASPALTTSTAPPLPAAISSPPRSPLSPILPDLLPSSISSEFSAFFALGHVLQTNFSATVYLCTRVSDGAEYACRLIPKSRFQSQLEMQPVLREVSVMKKLSTESTPQDLRCILELHDAVQDADSVYLITDLCRGGNLEERLAKRKLIGDYDDMFPTVPLFTEAEAASIVKSLLEALQTCHSRGIIHGNVEPRNIQFVDESDKDVSIKLSGFERATVSGRSFVMASKKPASFFTAPETVKVEGGIYGKHVDLWSVGIVLYILLFGEPPFSGQNEESLRLSILYSHVPFSDDVDWSSVSVSAKTFVQGLLCRDPASRMTASEALEHPWILGHVL